ncbi:MULTISPECIES: hypothetical protein [unclassified Paenibacillus]|uniref:hypothetical protein n=1 Tax=unclassified Paenibacillus TaxID=185978 RepID=UPI00240610F1|nr:MULTISPECIES: hypothetical protein [unclassified Paenibacillus]MDF9843756.1 hypothetical protein [Paenibacillus sp. PastF-2]MDF9850405.1 hypothetical protein [Paenibacillus sp. PastM-2]MDF9856892.1 hypothetical protein [Paenibacillus sp. PastF-1]MDH6482251.1 hypothetical protein [Paenibacillus sp. PastH-2]MDH6509585.1 hypothetical protein [Paenibacillus sp. PastM-3]
MIQNEQFWTHWRNGEFEQAMKCSVSGKTKRKGSRLFGSPMPPDETDIVAGISAGDFLYDFLMINPTVVAGIDFARSEDLSSAFSLAQFAKTVDLNLATGDMAQLQGYVAEQMIAQRLEAAGYDVQFPETSNQAGWDILVDGKEFQVKCGSNKAIVDEHLERYPDIPVYVNDELALHYPDHSNVYSAGLTKEAVVDATNSTLSHAEDLLDLEVPWISAGVSSFYNLRRVVREQLPLQLAARNVVIDTTSRASLAAAGQAAFTFAAGAIFSGGAFAVVLPLVGAYAGLQQSSRVADKFKKLLAKSQYQHLEKCLQDLVVVMKKQLNQKAAIKQEKWQTILQKSFNTTPISSLAGIHQEKLQFIGNMNNELTSIEHEIPRDPVRAFERLIAVLMKSGIHVYSIQNELLSVENGMKELQKKL